jgi:hypothetical protein
MFAKFLNDILVIVTPELEHHADIQVKQASHAAFAYQDLIILLHSLRGKELKHVGINFLSLIILKVIDKRFLIFVVMQTLRELANTLESMLE